MADIIVNVSKGRLAAFGDLAAANDAILLIPVEASGVETDAALRDKTTVADFFAGTTNEQTTLGRKTISASVTVTVDQSNDRVDVDIPDQVWAASAGNPISDLLAAYDADTTAGTDANVTPVSVHDFVATPDGSDLTGTIAAAGIWSAG